MLIPRTLPHDFSESCFSTISKRMLVFLLCLFQESQTPFSKAWDCTEIAQCVRMVQGAGALEEVSQQKNSILYISKALVGPEGGCRQGMSLIFCSRFEASSETAMTCPNVPTMLLAAGINPRTSRFCPECWRANKSFPHAGRQSSETGVCNGIYIIKNYS